jgi:small subunit ribosomal protein S18
LKKDNKKFEDNDSAGSKPFFRRKKTCPFSGPEAIAIDFRDTKTLSKFVSERGKIIPARISAVSAPKQRKLSQAIKRARILALIPYLQR